MTENSERCTSCKSKIIGGATKFMCPNCGKVEIIRCRQCKKLGVRYKCSSCSFEGPN